jgi:nucleoside-diphosphate-sugar epimerase
MPLVDVRDCAELHVKALKVPEAAGKRFIAWKGQFSNKEIAEILHGKFAADGWPIVTNEAEGDEPAREGASTRLAKEILGHEFRPIEDTVIDMAQCMIDSGFVKKPAKE